MPILIVNVSDSIIDQQNDTKSIEEVPEVPDKEIDDFIPEEPANIHDSVIAQLNQCKPSQIEEVITKVNHQEGSLVDRKTDAFLNEVYKIKVSDEIRQRKRRRNFKRENWIQRHS